MPMLRGKGSELITQNKCVQTTSLAPIARLAQLIEHLCGIQEVISLILVSVTNNAGIYKGKKMINTNLLEQEISQLKSRLSFREYVLKEAKQVGFIYHFTTLSTIENILISKIKKGNQKYVSLTRDFQLPNEKGYFNTGEYIVRIVIDGNKLSENVKIIPHRDIDYNDEREEGALNDISLKYIKYVDILTSDTRVFSDTAINAVHENLLQIAKGLKLDIRKIKKFQPVK